MPISMGAGQAKNRVILDVRMAHYTGIGRYITNLVTFLPGEKPKQPISLYGFPESRPLGASFHSFLESQAPVYSIREQVEIPNVLKECDILHVPHYNAPLLWGRKLIVTIHDLTQLQFPNFLPSWKARAYASAMIPLVAQKADLIIAISNSTKRDLIDFCAVPEKKIHVIYHGLNPFFCKAREKPAKTTAPYVLYVGMIKAHKNIGRLLSVFLKLRRNSAYENLELHLVGQPDLKQKEVRGWLETIKTNPSITLNPQLGDEELKREYQNASVFVQPSYYEGFGFPALEAMACGAPVILSDNTSLPEVAGEAGVYFDPRSDHELEEAMRKLLDHEKIREEMIERGLRQCTLFDWHKTARKTMALYEHLSN